MLDSYQTRTPSKPRGRPPTMLADPMPTDQPIVVGVEVVASRLRCRQCGHEYDAKVHNVRGAARAPTCRCPKCGRVDLLPRLGR
jgi:hypothetical protein